MFVPSKTNKKLLSFRRWFFTFEIEFSQRKHLFLFIPQKFCFQICAIKPCRWVSWEFPTHPEECTKLWDLQLLIQPGSNSVSSIKLDQWSLPTSRRAWYLVDGLFCIFHSISKRAGLIPTIPYIVLGFFFRLFGQKLKNHLWYQRRATTILSPMTVRHAPQPAWYQTMDVGCSRSLSLSFSTRLSFKPLFNTKETWNYETPCPSYTCI